jgi:cyclase
MVHFKEVYQQCDVDGALAASVFHKEVIEIVDLKNYLADKSFEPKIEIRLC